MSKCTGAWAAGTVDTNQFIQADLLNTYLVSGVITKGRNYHDQRVTSFRVNIGIIKH